MTVQRTADAVCLLAPAKVNLHLRVASRRADGYHELCTVMMALDLADRIRIQRTGTPGARLSVSDPSLAADNLVCRAWEAFAGRTRVAGGVRIELVKRIPVGAGLGGGSSDAAAALAGFDALFDTRLGAAALAELGGSIGSDVPFFFADSPLALCRGRGEVVEALPAVGRPAGVLVAPPFGCSTAAVYAEYDREPASAPAVSAPLSVFEGDSVRWPRGMVNDLAAAAERVEPRLKSVRDALAALAPHGLLMTGSGSGFYCLCRDETDAARFQAAAADLGLGAVHRVHRWEADRSESGCFPPHTMNVWAAKD
jgi:4-diphosphocytidyl-2-C-methyl-D-erythritol kinase